MKFSESLTKNYEFRRLYSKGKSAAGPFIVIYARKNRLGKNRLGITVGKKIGGAVIRNKLRRRIKETYRINEHRLLPGYDIVIVARTRAIGCGFKELESSFLTLAGKLGFLKR